MSEGPVEKVGWAFAQFFFDHPRIAGAIGIFLLASFAASCICSGIKTRWKNFDEIPNRWKWALGVLMPLAMNWWTLSRKVGGQAPPQPGAP